MLNLAKLNPHGNGYVFWGEKKERPCGSYTPAAELKKMLFRIRAGENPRFGNSRLFGVAPRMLWKKSDR
jgi:hypothetical protein